MRVCVCVFARWRARPTDESSLPRRLVPANTRFINRTTAHTRPTRPVPFPSPVRAPAGHPPVGCSCARYQAQPASQHGCCSWRTSLPPASGAFFFYRATLSASAVLAIGRCLSLRPSVRPSRSCVVPKRIKLSSNFFSARYSPSF